MSRVEKIHRDKFETGGSLSGDDAVKKKTAPNTDKAEAEVIQKVQQLKQVIKTMSAKDLEIEVYSAPKEVFVQLARDTKWLEILLDEDYYSFDMRKLIYDEVYEFVNSRTTLERMIKGRFGVKMGSDGRERFQGHLSDDDVTNEKQWDIEGLRHAYESFLLVPASHLNELKVATTTDKNCSDVNGWTVSKQRGINFNYNAQNIDRKTDSSRYCMYEGNDLLVGQNEFNAGFIHEVGHNTERDPKRYSIRNDFRDLFGWNHADQPLGTVKDRKLVDKIAACCEIPFESGLSNESQNIGMDVVHIMLKEHYSSLKMCAHNEIERLSLITKILKQLKRKNSITFKHVSVEDLAPKLAHSKVSEVACSGIEKNIPFCFERPNHPCPVRQIHEGSENDEWYSYNGNARNEKYSNYAFKNPAESFAEMYACYFLTEGKNYQIIIVYGLKQTFLKPETL